MVINLTFQSFGQLCNQLLSLEKGPPRLDSNRRAGEAVHVLVPHVRHEQEEHDETG
jgi:hypothetical protein